MITLEDGLSFATNQNNLLLQLKGLSSSEDYQNADDRKTVIDAGIAPPTPFAPPPAQKNPNSVLDMIE